jgi:RHS repeat-associated protein
MDGSRKWRDSQRTYLGDKAARERIRNIRQTALQDPVALEEFFPLVASIAGVPYLNSVLPTQVGVIGHNGLGFLPSEGGFPIGGSRSLGDSQGLSAVINSATATMTFSLPITGWSSVGDSAVNLGLIYAAGITSPEFGSWSHAYNSRVDVSAPDAGVMMPDGLEYFFFGDLSGNFTRSPGIFADLESNSGGGFTLTFKDQKKWIYDSTGWLVQTKDRVGNTVTINRDTAGKIQYIASSDARQLTFSYGSGGAVTLTGPDSRVWAFTKPTSSTFQIQYPTVTTGGVPSTPARTIGFTGSQLTSETDLRGETGTWTYGGSNWVTYTDALSRTTSVAEPDTGQVRLTLPGGQQLWHVYKGTDGMYVSVDAAGYETLFFDRDSNFLPNFVQNDSGYTEFTWDSYGNILDTTNPVGDVTYFEYNAQNDPIKVYKPKATIGGTKPSKSGPFTGYAYNTSGLLSQVTGKNGIPLATLDYNTNGDLIEATDGMGVTTTFDPNLRGEVEEIIDPSGFSTTMTYDNYSRLKEVDRAGKKTTTTYDEWGRTTKTTYAAPTGVTRPDTERLYDLGGNVLKSWNEIDKMTEWSYDDAGQISWVKNPNLEQTNYTYNSNGWLTKITNAKLEETNMYYTNRGELLEQSLADGTYTTYGYNPSGTVYAKVKPDNTIIYYAYNELDQLEGINYPSPMVDTAFEYDIEGRRTSMVDATGTTTWEYDDLGRLETLTQGIGTGSSYATAYTYNYAGQRETMVSPSGTTTYAYEYTTPGLTTHTGRLLSMTNPLGEITTYDYDAEGRIEFQQYHNGTKEFYDYDERDRVKEILLKNSSGTVLRDLDYVFNDASQVTNLTTTISGTPDSVGYSYDDAGQLTLEDRSGTSLDISYTYDANGNRATKTLGGVTDTYNYLVADKLENIYRGGSKIKDYAYDDNGNTIFLWESGVGAKAFTYDAENRISAISGAYTASYSYNGLDTRVSKTEASVSTNFRRDGAGVTSPVIEDSYARYTPGISESRGATPSTSVTKYMHSGIKSADVQTNSSQTIDATRKYDAFGAVLSSTGTWSGPFGNAGKFGYQEDGTGYQLLGHRYYDPSTGRFLSRDPIQDGRNWYAYCANQPTIRADATGLVPPLIVAAIVVVGLTLMNPASAPTGPNDAGDHSAGEAHNEWATGMFVDLMSMKVGRVADGLGDLVQSATPGKPKPKPGGAGSGVDNSKPQINPRPVRKPTYKLRKEWEELYGKPWPMDPTRPGKPMIAHHRDPIADGGIDNGSNIEPMEYQAHIDHHRNNGDFKRWGGMRYSR